MQEGKDGPSSFQTTGRWPYFAEGSTESTELEEVAVTSLEPRQISAQMCRRHVCSVFMDGFLSACILAIVPCDGFQ